MTTLMINGGRVTPEEFAVAAFLAAQHWQAEAEWLAAALAVLDRRIAELEADRNHPYGEPDQPDNGMAT